MTAMNNHDLGSVSTTYRIESINRENTYAIELTSCDEQAAILVATALVELTDECWRVVRSKVVTEEKTVFTGGAPYVHVSTSRPRVTLPATSVAGQVFTTSVGRTEDDD